MHPVFIRFGEGGVPTYGVAMAAGFLTAVLLSVRAAGRQGVSVNRILDLSFWVLLASLLGSRLAFVAVHAGEYYQLCAGGGGAARSTGQVIFDCTRALHIWEGGYVFFGGLVLSIGVSLWYTRRHGLSFPRVADVAIPPLALGHFFGRLGCFAAGCCYGKPTVGALGVAFPRGSLAQVELARDGKLAPGATATMPLHPTQLYEALAELVNFVLLTVWSPRKAYHGQLLVRYLALYPMERAVIELFRGDPGRGFLARLHTPGLNSWLGLPPDSVSLVSLSQLTAVVAVAGAVLLSRYLRRRAALA
jgi:phosphatidylglycerol:prolipoprotein diacylglycerol transferase